MKITKKKSKTIPIITLILILLISGIIIVASVLYNSKFHETKIVLNKNYSELFTDTETQRHLSDTPLSSYLTDATVAYQNIDGSTSLYVYAMPVNYLENGKYKMKDTRIVNVQNDALRQKGFVYTVAANDVIPYYPKELSQSSGIRLSKDFYYDFGLNLSKAVPARYTEKENFIGEKKNMVTYKNEGTNINFYPSPIGTNCEINFTKKPNTNKLSFWLKLPDTGLELSKEEGGYLVIYKIDMETTIDGAPEKSIVAVIQPPLLKDSNNKVYYNNSVDYTKTSDGNYNIEFTLDSQGLSKNAAAYTSWEMRIEKQPDTALYSGKPYMQYAYLINRSILGDNPDYGMGKSLVRYYFCKPLQLKSEDVKQANYYMYDISRLDKTHPIQDFQMFSVLDDWCSVLVNWNEPLEIGTKTSEYRGIDTVLNFDITNEVKKWCDDSTGLMERKGVLLMASDKNKNYYDVLLTNDNALFRNRTEIILK